jgi:hypothetical protein
MAQLTKPTAALLLLLAVSWFRADARAVQTKKESPGLKPGDVWALVLLNEQGSIMRSLVVRVTKSPAPSCRGGKWNRLDVLDERPRSDSGDKADAAYEVSTTEVTMDLAIGVCDGYRPLHGEISDLGMQGTHGTLGLGGGRTLGRFYGTRVPQSAQGSRNP